MKAQSIFKGFGVQSLRKQLALKLACKHVPYISGAPGIGKTRIIEQVAHDMNHEPLTFIISQMMPEDLGGMVTADTANRTAIRLMPDILDRINQTRESTGKPVLAFFDEINNGSSLMFGALMNLVLERCAAGFCVPEDTLFVCAGNPPEVSSVAQELPAPLVNRMSLIHFAGPTLDEWVDYALTRRFHPAVVGFLKLDANARYLKDAADFNTGDAQPTPRSWERVSETLRVFDKLRGPLGLTVKDRMLAIASDVGDEAAQMMEVALKYGDELTPWAEIKADPKNAKVPDSFVPSFMQTMTLINCIESGDDMLAGYEYLKRMPKEMRGIFGQGLSKSPHFGSFYEAIIAHPEIAEVIGSAGLVGASLSLKQAA